MSKQFAEALNQTLQGIRQSLLERGIGGAPVMEQLDKIQKLHDSIVAEIETLSNKEFAELWVTKYRPTIDEHFITLHKLSQFRDHELN